MDEQALLEVKQGLECFQLEQFDSALMHFNRVLESTPHLHNIKILQAETLAQLKQYHLAKETIENFLLLEPEHEKARQTLNNINQQLQQSKQPLPVPCLPRPEFSKGKDLFLFDSKNPVIVSQEGILFDAKSQQAFAEQQSGFIRESHVLPALENIHHLSGTWISLRAPWANTFFHWFFELLPQVLLAEHLGFTGKYLLDATQTFVMESLQILGLEQERFVNIPAETVMIERLQVPSHRSAQALQPHEFLYEQLRERLRKAIQPTGAQNRLYISRNGRHGFTTCWRKVINETELETLLAKYHFDKVHLEELSLREQLQLSTSCNAAVLPHGAGLTHSLFMQEKSLIVELFPPTYINYCFLAPMKLLRHRYYTFCSPMEQLAEYRHGVNILAPIDCIEATLERELG